MSNHEETGINFYCMAFSVEDNDFVKLCLNLNEEQKKHLNSPSGLITVNLLSHWNKKKYRTLDFTNTTNESNNCFLITISHQALTPV